jgi:hypothetical protein
MNLLSKIILYLLGFIVLFFDPKIAFIYLIICHGFIYLIEKYKNKSHNF